MEHADQRKEPADGGEVGCHFSVQPLEQHFRRCVVHPAPGHVDGFDLAGARLADRLVIRIADREIFADRPAQPAQPQHQQLEQLPGLVGDLQGEAAILHRQPQAVGALMPGGESAQGLETVLLDEIEHRHPPFLLDIGVAREDRRLVEFDVNDARIGHAAPSLRKCADQGQAEHAVPDIHRAAPAAPLAGIGAKAQGSGAMPEEALILRAVEPQPRTLPANVEAEAAFLGAVLIDNRVIEELPVSLGPVHFFEPVHARIYERVLQLLDRKAVVTPVTLRPYFEADEALKELGGLTYLARLTADGQGLLAPRELAEQIYDLALLRELVSVGRNLVEGALDTSESVAPLEQIEQAEAALYAVAEGAGAQSEAQGFAHATRTALGMIEQALLSGGHVSGTTTGLTSINEKIGGLHDSDLLILAGRPGMGKTALATNIAFNAADRLRRDRADGIKDEDSIGAAVAFFSLEMSADQLATRVLAEQSGISSEMLRMGKISREDFQKLSFASQTLAELPLYIDDTPALSIAALRARARRLKRRHNVGLVIVDYLQLLQGTGRANDNRVNEISEISRGLKTLAKELGVPVMALSQLSRAVESREDKRPQLSDLRESGSIEQDADIVMFVFREDYYVAAREPKRPNDGDDAKTHEAHAKWAEDMERVYGLAELIISKQRHGATGKVRLRFEPRITRFSDLAGEELGGHSYD